MMEDREFHASNVEEAVREAAKSLGVSPEELRYEVLDEGSEGFLGIGARDARIRVIQEEGGDSMPEEPVDLEDGTPEEIGEVPENLLQEIERLTSEIVNAMGLGGRVDVYDAGEYIAADVATDHTAILIGQKGETIDALQFLINSAVYRNRPFVKRIILDSEGYRQRRIEAIQGIAHRSARRAIRERRSIKLPPMSPAERRIVHVYLKDNPRVTTFSEGSGPNRRVTVAPNL
ncbi:DNA-binding protein [Rubrobacter xylanophilus]|uniref:RNA-binding protein KhpB n=1 Tax=Rubrobacter xylanophilus TaxID=49319 RepID=A0A510HKH2_9ACTN|nr:RNA-binding cell elongation regulator Jag/EloR [Rubrobacter xylanophilus]BBL80526.1 DNA-binding protein [Rubrobacter xylanophilus]